MKNVKFILGLGAFLIITGGSGLIVYKYPNTVPPVDNTPNPTIYATPTPSPSYKYQTPTPSPIPTPTVASYSISDVALHNNANNCWSAISGKVYDLTSFTRNHPGGSSAIISLCGIDGTSGFLNQHAGQRRPESELQSLFIGNLR